MQQILNITQVRNTLSDVVMRVAQTKNPVVIVRDSMPAAVIVSYDTFLKDAEDEAKLWSLKFDRVLSQGKQAFALWGKKRGINVKKLTEEEAYEFIRAS
ncbi:MAG: type II toxin-antitoxin system Phd/YefM family antitoxin [Candidatus Gottesmanbacteria bacterium]|nr:type II toxin-antitoxin system Phd/YefM family antitoxin [Candidatus Gottesmanbacteria bacterium]